MWRNIMKSTKSKKKFQFYIIVYRYIIKWSSGLRGYLTKNIKSMVTPEIRIKNKNKNKIYVSISVYIYAQADGCTGRTILSDGSGLVGSCPPLILTRVYSKN
jgi:hypothetical protein